MAICQEMKNKFKLIQIETYKTHKRQNIKIAIYKMTQNAVRNVLKKQKQKQQRI